MSVLLGYRNKAGRTLLCSDSFTYVKNGELVAGHKNKITIAGPLAIGFVGDARSNNVTANNHEKIAAAYAQGIRSVIMTLRDLFKEDGYTTCEHPGGPITYDFVGIIAAPCGLYLIGSAFGEDAYPVGRAIAVGSGGDVALGAAAGWLWGSSDCTDDALTHIGRVAVSASIQHVPTTGGHVNVVLTGGEAPTTRKYYKPFELQPLPDLE